MTKARHKNLSTPRIPKAMIELVEEIFPVLARCTQRKEEEKAIKQTKEDPEVCLLSILLEIKSHLWPGQPRIGIGVSLNGAVSDWQMDQARKLLDEEAKAEVE